MEQVVMVVPTDSLAKLMDSQCPYMCWIWDTSNCLWRR